MEEEQPFKEKENQEQSPVENYPNDLSIPSTEIGETLTSNMEVHHHPDLHHKRKKWKEYFFEFLMIFLAVTLGFFAENLREQIKDNKEIHRNIQSLQSDLKSDITMYDSTININSKNCRVIDTLIGLLHIGKHTGKIYYLARMLTIGQGIFTPDSKTFDMLKSTGGLRLIDDQNSLDSINAYYQFLKYFDYWSALQRQRINEVIEGNEKLFDATIFLSIYKGIDNPGSSTWKEASNPPLLSRNPLLVNSVVMHFQYLYGVLKILNRKAAEAESKALRLNDLLQVRFRLATN